MSERGPDGLYDFQREMLHLLDDELIIKQIVEGTYVSQMGKTLETGGYRGERGPKPPGIEVFINTPINVEAIQPPNMYQDVFGRDNRNRHERRKAARLNRK